LSDLETVLGAPGTVLVNAAGQLSGSESELYEANVAFVEYLAGACDRADATCLQLGSAAEYGLGHDATGWPHQLAETEHPHPRTPYGRSKLAATEFLARWHSDGKRACVARLFNVVGAPARAGEPAADLAESVVALGPRGGVVSVRNAAVERDFAVVDWVAARVVELAADFGGEPVVNVCTGVSASLSQLLMALGDVAGVPVELRDLGEGRPSRVVGDPTRLARLLGPLTVPTLHDVAAAALAAAPSYPDEG
jgi:nucleoside-diphosphate-sugar epimerase